jgi:hypothetical protein
MGLFTGLLTLPLAPVRGVVWVADQVGAEADRQLFDEGRIRSELLALEFEVQDGRLSEAEAGEREDELLERLAISRSRSGGAGWLVGPAEWPEAHDHD